MLKPPQAPLIEIDYNISKPLFKTKYFTFDSTAIEPIEKPEFVVSITDENYFSKNFLKLKMLLEPPQPPEIEVVDTAIKNIPVAKNFNKCSVRGPLFLFLVYPFCGEENLKNKSSLFRLDSPQAPSVEIEDKIANSISRIKNINETFSSHVSTNVFILLQGEGCSGLV